ncbi:MAG TPA: hypothetical protein VN603_01830 [Candidatus Acidoferrales bacterium]|jgi:hypothetical protein|nr:hypothetical protein [Candidatus Acidoferrales bacterium]
MIAVQDLAPGTKVKLRGDVVAEVTENPRDGVWMYVRYVDGPAAGREEMVHADDVLGLV